MQDHDALAEQFETHRSNLRAVAYRMLGSASEADDAVQDAWLRASRADTSRIENMRGWLTTIVARVCLNVLQARKSRREEPLGAGGPEPIATHGDGINPEQEALLADSVGLALLVVLDTLAPAERLAFVLHDMFAVPFDEIAPIVGRSPAATRQLASRARRRVRAAPTMSDADLARQRTVVDAFLAAARAGDFDALVAVLDPDVVFRADSVAVQTAAAKRAEGAPELAPEVHGAHAVARTMSGRAQAARRARVNGAAGAVWAPEGEPRAAFSFTVLRGRIVAIDLVADPARIRELDLMILND